MVESRSVSGVTALPALGLRPLSPTPVGEGKPAIRLRAASAQQGNSEKLRCCGARLPPHPNLPRQRRRGSGSAGVRGCGSQCPGGYRKVSAVAFVLPFPVLDLFVVFIRRDLVHRGAESGGSGGLGDLAAQAASQRVELGRGEVGNVPLADGGLDLAELLAERVNAVGDGVEPFLAQRLKFDGGEVVDLELMFATPGDEGGLGDVEVGHEARIGPALGAEFDETIYGLLFVHIGPFLPERVKTNRIHPPE
jgi:hypothetical protein